MSRVFLIDTAYVIAVLANRDQYHDIALELSVKFLESDTFFYTEAVIYESFNAMNKQPLRAAVGIFFDELAENPRAHLLHTTKEQLSSAMQYFQMHPDKEWSLVDCVSFLTMAGKKIPYALTADRHFEQAGYVALLRSPEMMS